MYTLANSNKHAHIHTGFETGKVAVTCRGLLHGSSVWGQGLSQVQMKEGAETLEELNNAVGHLAWQRDQCLFDWLRDGERKREREREKDRDAEKKKEREREKEREIEWLTAVEG